MRPPLLLRTQPTFDLTCTKRAGSCRRRLCLSVLEIVATSDFTLWLSRGGTLEAFPRRFDEALQAHPRRVHRRLPGENDCVVKESAECASNERA